MENMVHDHDLRLDSSDCDIDMGEFKNQTSNDVSTTKGTGSLSLNLDIHSEKDGLSTDHLSTTKCTAETGNLLGWDWDIEFGQDGLINFFNWSYEEPSALIPATTKDSQVNEPSFVDFWDQGAEDVELYLRTSNIVGDSFAVVHDEGIVKNPSNQESSVVAASVNNSITSVDTPELEAVKVATKSSSNEDFFAVDEGIVKNPSNQESSVVAVKNSITSVDIPDREAVNVATKNSSNEEFFTVDCNKHKSSKSSLPLMEEDRSSLENNKLTIDDVTPIDAARERLLDIILAYFIKPTCVTQSSDYEADPDHMVRQSSQDKVLIKRKSGEFQYDDDYLPLMYILNMYETFVNEGNKRLSSLNGMHGETIGVALEGAGGLYRKFKEKFPKEGIRAFKRRELAASETRSRFPELVIPEEKRVRFPVVNALTIIEKPTEIDVDDAEWFKRLTGRHEVAVCARDYKFYSQRHKPRHVVSKNIPSLPEASPAIFCDQCGSRYLMESSKFCPRCGAKRLEI